MPFIPTTNVARSALRQVLFGQDVVNTLWFQSGPIGWNEQSLEDLNADIIGWWGTNIAPILSDELTLVEVTSTDQTTSIAPSVVTATVTPGTAAGNSLPGNVCVTIKFNTANRGRSGRGRNYVGGLRESDVIGNILGAVPLQALIDAYDLLRTNPLLSGAATWVVVSHYFEGAARQSGFAQPINSVGIADNAIDSQRRRLTGRGS